MSQVAVLPERKEKRRKRGTASEPARAPAAQNSTECRVQPARKPSNPLVRASRKVFGGMTHYLAEAAWHTFQAANRLVPYPRLQPKWAPSPLLKSNERSKPPLGFPRETDSLCPRCVLEIRAAILEGREDWQVLIQGKPDPPDGLIPAWRSRRSPTHCPDWC